MQNKKNVLSVLYFTLPSCPPLGASMLSDMMCIGEIYLKTNDDTYLKKFKLMFKIYLRPILITLDLSKLANKINYLTKTIENSLMQNVFIR